jgi:transposase InsO family protein
MAPEGLYGRRKMLAPIRRNGLPHASFGAVDRAMRALGLSGVRRSKGVRTTAPAEDGVRASDLPCRDFTASRPNEKWVTDFTYCRTGAGWVYACFITDCFADKIVAWHASTAMDTSWPVTLQTGCASRFGCRCKDVTGVATSRQR